jgi:hypothetical protein
MKVRDAAKLFEAYDKRQAITASHPLQNDKGEPTPAALQFKRWGFPVPKTQDDLRELKALGARLKERYKPRES